MKSSVQGAAHVFGDNLDTDQIYPGKYLELAREEDIKRHAMEGADPDFVKNFNAGDIIVGGTNFGCGSSREHAIITLKAIGTSAILAESFARIFYRNGINLGIPLLVCPGIKSAIVNGDALEIDLEKGSISNRTQKTELTFQPVSDYVKEILENGGIKALVRKQLSSR
ncbi:3-isopropylmalate dehydratase small subunit [bacterium]|nr:3-isopropylmalate dehydratase small subunit [bacterium]